MTRSLVSLWVAALFVFSTAIGPALADERSDAHWYCGAVYSLKSSSELAAYLGLDRLLIKQLASDEYPLLLTLNNGSKFAEMNVPIRFSQSKKRFEFATDRLDECQGYDCVGVAGVSGFLKRGRDTFREELHVQFSFYKDYDGKLKEWTETLTFIGAPSDGGYCAW